MLKASEIEAGPKDAYLSATEIDPLAVNAILMVILISFSMSSLRNSF